ncbi:hypothetical protein [Cumulibacter soli]|uniref:hypothetical protein n=1 Tax=Cumulibacter soli TaxID=2546344 RepID=UPI00106857F5|nr:hypothetical protein [Cumulibacter soli]
MALLLGIAGCSNTTDGTGSSGSSDSSGAPPATDGYSVQNALSTLPALESDELITVVTADLDAATEQSGLERPTSFDDTDGLVAWLYPLTGVANESIEPAPVFVPVAQGFQVDYLMSPMEPTFPEEVGWSVLDAATFAERQTLPQLLTVVTGDFDSSTFPESLPEVADGVVTAGEGDDHAQDIANPTMARPLGIPLRMATKDSSIAAGRSTDELTQWLDGPDESLADDPELAAVAAALDDAGSVSAVLSSGAIHSIEDLSAVPGGTSAMKDELAGMIPAGAFDTVGIGWAAEGGDPVITVAYAFTGDGDASDAVPVFEEMFANASSIVSGAPLSDFYSLQDAQADGSVVVLTLGPGDAGAPITAYHALMENDLPFVKQ